MNPMWTVRSSKLAAALMLTGALGATACTGSGADDRDRLDLGADPISADDLPEPDIDPSVLDLTLDTFDGGSIRLTDIDGPIVVNFWASFCAPCVDEMPEFEAVHQTLGDSVTFVGINTTDRVADADEFAGSTGVTYTLVRDPEGVVAAAFEVIALPVTVVFGADHEVVEFHTGQISAEDLADTLSELGA